MASQNINFSNYGSIKVNGVAIYTAKLNGNEFWSAGTTSASIGTVNMTYSNVGTFTFSYWHNFPTKLRPGRVRMLNYVNHNVGQYVGTYRYYSTYKLYNGSKHLATHSYDSGNKAGSDNYTNLGSHGHTIDKSYTSAEPITRIWYSQTFYQAGSSLGYWSTTTKTGTSRFNFSVS